MSNKWIWINAEVALAAHAEQLLQHGGGDGVRDQNMLESAWARPLNLVSHGDPDASDLAAAYAYGLACNHAFVDGNKRTAAIVSEVFLNLNDHILTATNPEIVVAMVALAAGDLAEEELAAWFRDHIEGV